MIELDARELLSDVTDEFSDLAPEDRIYRAADHTLVKVKALITESPPDLGGVSLGYVAVISLTGSICGADGKALRRDGEPIVWRLNYRHYLKAEGDDRPAEKLEEARRFCAVQTLRAEKAYQLLNTYRESPLPGLVTAADYAARKAAEAAQEKTDAVP